MDWVPIIFLVFKFIVLGTGMFFAVKWHYDQETGKGTVLRKAGKMAAIFVLSLLGLMLLTFTVARMLGLNLAYP